MLISANLQRKRPFNSFHQYSFISIFLLTQSKVWVAHQNNDMSMKVIPVYSLTYWIQVSIHCKPYPQVCVLEITAIVLDYEDTITLLHNGDFLDDLLQICVHRNLFDGQDLARFLVKRFVNAAIGSTETLAER